MKAFELADAMEIRASIRKKATNRKSVQENANDRLADQLTQAATMLRKQQAEIEALKQQYELYGAVWHDEHGYQFTATVGEKVLNNDRWIKLYRKVEK